MKNITFIFKNLKKYDYYTILFFISGFLFSALDFKIMNFFELALTNFSKLIFIALYILMFLFIVMTLKIFAKNANNFKIKDKLTIINVLKIISIGYYIGILINISNSFIIILFQNFFI